MFNTDVENILNECQRDLDLAQSIINSLGITSNIVQYVTKYSLIKACSTIEISYKSIIADYCEWRSKKQVKKFISRRIRDSSSNPSYDNICKTLNEFDSVWANTFKNNLDLNPSKSTLLSSLQSLVASRNEFAHGGNPTLSIQSIIDYYKNSREIIEVLDSVIQ